MGDNAALRAAAAALGNTPPATPAIVPGSPGVAAAAPPPGRPSGLAALAAATRAQRPPLAPIRSPPPESPGGAAAAAAAPGSRSSVASSASLASYASPAAAALPQLPINNSGLRRKGSMLAGLKARTQRVRKSNRINSKWASKLQRTLKREQKRREELGLPLLPVNISQVKNLNIGKNTVPLAPGVAHGFPNLRRPAKKAYNKSRYAREAARSLGSSSMNDPRHLALVKQLRKLYVDPPRFTQKANYGFDPAYLKAAEEAEAARQAAEEARRLYAERADREEAAPYLEARAEAYRTIERLAAAIEEAGAKPAYQAALGAAKAQLKIAEGFYDEGEGGVTETEGKEVVGGTRGSGYRFYASPNPEPPRIGLGGNPGLTREKLEALKKTYRAYDNASRQASKGLELLYAITEKLQRRAEAERAAAEREAAEARAEAAREAYAAAQKARKDELEAYKKRLDDAIGRLEDHIRTINSNIQEYSNLVRSIENGPPLGKKLISDKRAGNTPRLVNKNTPLGSTDKNVDYKVVVAKFTDLIHSEEANLPAANTQLARLKQELARVKATIKKL
jgi:hypothetical protein